MAKALNINHSNSSILTSDGTYIQLGNNGSIKVGYGTNLEEPTINNLQQNTLAEYEGAIRINRTTHKLEYCDGTSWLEFTTDIDGDESLMVYSMLF